MLIQQQSVVGVQLLTETAIGISKRQIPREKLHVESVFENTETRIRFHMRNLQVESIFENTETWMRLHVRNLQIGSISENTGTWMRFHGRNLHLESISANPILRTHSACRYNFGIEHNGKATLKVEE